MEKLLKKIKPKYYWAIAFVLSAIAMYVMLSYSQVLSTGKYIILAGDSLQIYASNIRMMIRSLINGENIWYSFSSSMGNNNALTVAFELLSPFNILYYFFYNVDVNKITAVIIILKTGLSAAAFQLFAAKVLKSRGLSSVVFGIFYSMSAFAVLYGIFNFMWLDGMYSLPIVAMAIYMAVYQKKYVLLTVSYAYIFITQFYLGYMIGIFSLMYFILLLVVSSKEERGTSVGKCIANYLLSFASSVLLAAFVWMPVLMFLRSQYASDSTQFAAIEISAMELFNNFFWGEFQDYYRSPYVYCGIPSLLLLPFFFMNKTIEKKEKIVYGILLLFFSACCLILPLYQLMHAFDAPDMWNYRFTFIISFILCVMACRQFDRGLVPIGKKLYGYLAFLVIFYLVEGKLEVLQMGYTKNNGTGLLINVGWLLLWCIMAWALVKVEKQKDTVKTLIIFLALAECITNGCYRMCSWDLRGNLEKEDFFYKWSEEMNDVMLAVEEDPNRADFYRMYVMADLNKNADSYWGYNGISDFGTAENERLRLFLRDMGIYTTVRRTSSTGMTKPLEMLLSVQYKVRLYTSTEVAGLEAPPRVVSNPNFLPVAYMAEDDCLNELAFTDNVFENQNMVFESLSGIKGLYRPVAKEQISYYEEGLVLGGENKNILMREGDNDGMLTISTQNVANDVYLQISSNAQDEILEGVYFSLFENQVFDEDCSAWIPCTVKMWKNDETDIITDYVSLRSEGDYTIAFETTGINIYECDAETMDGIYNELSKETLQVEETKEGYVKGRIRVNDDKRVLFFSIPYIEGWSAKVNGKECEVLPALNDTFLAIVLPDQGDYTVELKYRCPGAKTGVLFSIAGLNLLILQWLLMKFAEKKKARTEQN